MESRADALVRRVHSLALASAVVLYATSPWIAMLRRLPRTPSAFDWAHVAAGIVAVVAAAGLVVVAFRAGRWRLYFPWLSGRTHSVLADLAGLLRGRLPASEGGGLTSALQGFTVAAFALTAASGAAWLLTNGGDSALAWRSVHVVSADVLGVLIVVHAVTALLHVIQMARG
jgi:cytochrome b561